MANNICHCLHDIVVAKSADGNDVLVGEINNFYYHDGEKLAKIDKIQILTTIKLPMSGARVKTLLGTPDYRGYGIMRNVKEIQPFSSLGLD